MWISDMAQTKQIYIARLSLNTLKKWYKWNEMTMPIYLDVL